MGAVGVAIDIGMQKQSSLETVVNPEPGRVFCVSFVGNPDDNLIRLTPVDDEIELPLIPGIEPVGPGNALPESIAVSDQRTASELRAEEVKQWQKQFLTAFIAGTLVLALAVLAMGWISASLADFVTPIGSLEEVARRWDILHIRTWPLAFALIALGLLSLIFSPQKG